MMFVMNSKVFQNHFLINEKDKDILKSQYVLISTRIRKTDEKFGNVITAQNFLFPTGDVMMKLTDEDVREAYFYQLEENKVFLATLVKGSIEKGFNIIFMCTKNEDKLHFLKYLSEYIFMEFGYPVYEYKSYVLGYSSERDYDKSKVIKKCNKILKVAKDQKYHENLKSDYGRAIIKNDFRQLTKKEMKKQLESRNLYTKGMTRKEMIEVFELFL